MNFVGGGYQSMDTGGGSYAYGGGGGYMQDSQGFGGSPAGDKKRGGQSRLQTLVPLTAAQIHSIEMNHDDSFVLDGKEIQQIEFIGEIIEVNETATAVMYKIDDRTGAWVEVRKWMDEQENPEQLQNRAACREGVYVRVVGQLKIFNKQKSIIGFNVRPIEDFNEISEHLAGVMYAHLALTKGPLVPEQFQHPAHGASAPVGGSGVGVAWGNPMATSTQLPGVRAAYAGSRANIGLSSLQHQVLEALSGSMTEEGVSIYDVVKKLSTHGFSEKQIRSTVDFLSNEGHIYSTIDDDHFKPTES